MFLNSAQWGNFKLYSIETGRFRLDGGAMFGVVPKTLWSKRVPADDNNRIPMVMRCLLIESQQTGRRYLIDTGTGPKFDAKMRAIYDYNDQDFSMDQSLSVHGFTTDDITDVIFTHLHFDHCGGASAFDESGNLKLVFPNATHWVNRRHWENANNPNAREKASFLKDNMDPLRQMDRLIQVDDNHTWEPGLSCLNMDGHTIGMQLPVILGDSGKKMVYCADLIPMAAHVPLPWVMAYDMNPTQTLLEKEKFLQQAANEGWHLFIEHDEFTQVITVKGDGSRFEIDAEMTL